MSVHKKTHGSLFAEISILMYTDVLNTMTVDQQSWQWPTVPEIIRVPYGKDWWNASPLHVESWSWNNWHYGSLRQLFNEWISVVYHFGLMVYLLFNLRVGRVPGNDSVQRPPKFMSSGIYSVVRLKLIYMCVMENVWCDNTTHFDIAYARTTQNKYKNSM